MRIQTSKAQRRRYIVHYFRIILACTVLQLTPGWLLSQNAPNLAEQGQAIIHNYSSREYGASAQNWAVLQDNRGILYVGNNECLLEYDGHLWQRIPGTNGGVFALAQDSTGTIYVGGAGSFGYLQADASGKRHYIALSTELQAVDQKFGVIRSVHVLGDTVFFQSRQQLFLYHQGKLESRSLPDAYLRAYTVYGKYLVKLAGHGLCYWASDTLQVFPGGAQFADYTITFLLPFSDKKILVGTQKNGVWAFDPTTGTNRRPAGFQALQAQLLKEELYHGLQLPDGRYALATLSGGLYLTNSAGQLQRRITRDLGLTDNTVHFLYLDRQLGLWAAMNHGLDRIALQAPFQYWDKGLGLDAAVLCIKRHKKTLYVGTNLGLYAMQQPPTPSTPSRFQRVDENQRDQVFALEEATLSKTGFQQLLLATGSGIYAHNQPGKLQRIHQNDLGPIYSLVVSKQQPGILYAGGNRGLFRLEYKNGEWSVPEQISGENLLIRSVKEDGQGRIWVGTRNRGVARLEQQPDGTFKTTIFEKILDKPALGDHRIFQWGNRLLFRSSQYGAFQFDESSEGFQAIIFSDRPQQQNQPVWVAATGPGQNAWVWAPSGNGPQLEWLRENQDKSWDRIYQPFGVLPDIRDLFQGGFYPENEQVIWMGGALGLYRFAANDMPAPSYYQQAFTVLLRSVQIGGDSTLVVDWPNNTNRSWELSHLDNSIQFEFAALDFEQPENTRYSYYLEGYDRKWSIWTHKTEKEYTNLAPGKYQFRVRARNAFSQEDDSQAFTFVIQRPWYQSWWIYILYILLIGSIIFGLVRLLTRQQARRLERQEQINEQLRNADKLKDQFLANTSHELRTPLNGIIGLSESLQDGIGKFSEDKQREELSLIISSGRRLTALVNDLLDFSKLKEKDLLLQLAPVDLYALTDVVLQICQPLVAEKALKLHNKIPPDLTVLADEDRLQQILLNLVGNAVKFTNTGTVTVSAQTMPAAGEEQEVQVVIQDTGIGIPKDKHEQIFSAFLQADGSIEREFGGTGLGLAISKSLIELQGGRIWLESEEGEGSSFFFTLSASDAADPDKRSVQREPVSAPVENTILANAVQTGKAADNGNLVRILVVDDEPINHHVLRNHLEDQPFEISNAWNGEEALGFLESEKPFDLVLLDVMMPRMSGYEVCRKIRDKYLPSELPIIMITAKNQVQDLVQGLALGANDYLAKPFSKEEFLARVHTQLDLHRIFDVTARFVPNEFIRALGYERLTEVALGDHTQREVSVLFSDIRSYTSLSENMTPEENFRFVNAYNGRMGPVIRKHKGFVNQYLGDGIMAIFPQEAEQALQAAIDMQMELQAYNEKRRQKGQDLIRVGMGLHSGSLIMGITGDDARLDATTISDTVNTASRVESLTPYYNVNILLSEDSLSRIRDPRHYSLRYLGIVQVKGRKQPVGIYECFDGDEPEEIALKSTTLEVFNQAVLQFFNRAFEDAATGFKTVLRRNPKDAVAKIFLEKSVYCLENGVSKDWTGMEKMEQK